MYHVYIQSVLIKYVKILDNLVEAEPEFSEPIQNVTVAIGRDAQLSCTVENLGTYRVSYYFINKYYLFYSFFLFNDLYVKLNFLKYCYLCKV